MFRSLPLPEWDTVIRWFDIPGDGSPVVYLPSLCRMGVVNFLPMLMQPPLRHRRALVVDYIGSGLSGHSTAFGHGVEDHAEAVAKLLDSEDLGPVTLVGHSQGGSVSIALAFDRPDLVERLVVGEGNLTPGGGEGTRKIASIPEEGFVSTVYPEGMAKADAQALSGDWFSNFHVASRIGTDPVALHAISTSLVHLPDDFQDRFLALETERHFLWGEKTYPGNTGLVTPDAPDPDLLQRHGVGIHVIPAVGHGLMLEDPIAAAEIIGGILEHCDTR